MEPPFLPHPVVKSTPIVQSPTRLIRLPKTDHTPSAPFTAAQGSLAFKNMSMISPLLPLSGMISLPILPRLGAPDHCCTGMISIFDGSSSVADSSSSTLKIDSEHLANCARKTMLNRLKVPSDYFASVYEMLTALTLSAMVPPSDAAQLIQPLDVLQNDGPTIFTTLFWSRQHVVNLSTQIQFVSVIPLATASSLAAFMSPITTLDPSGNK